jgi:predicted transglutaminase-like cysteine proteinase
MFAPLLQRARYLKAAAAIGLVLVACAMPAWGDDGPALWGAPDRRNANIAPFNHWTGMLQRHMQERITLAQGCLVTRFSRCHWQDWLHFIAQARTRPALEQLTLVNDYMNRHPYVWDSQNWWKTPGEFFRVDGNCKDYAISKYLTLRLMGWPVEQLRVVVLNDLNLHLAHAVLAVYINGRILILDNQIRQVVDSTVIHHYQPIYSINEESWWLHRAQ